MPGSIERRALRDRLIREKFHEGYTPTETYNWLHNVHHIKISLRQIKRILFKFGLQRNSEQNLQTIIQAIKGEIEGTGGNLGYRNMWTRLITEHHLQVSRELVRLCMRYIDPEGMEERLKSRLKRRVYHSKGPNFAIHVDQYDKLRAYGFGIHGTICGFSRKILWLKVARTNRDPAVVAGYFLDYVKDAGGVPRLIRMDKGTENVTVTNMQKAFRSKHEDNRAGEKSVLLGESPANQRIERWWGELRVMMVEEYMQLFSNITNEGHYFQDDEFMVECLWYCFMSVIQADLDMIQRTWNRHRIRANSKASGPSGKPNILYAMPELIGAQSYLMPVDRDDILAMEQFVSRPQSTQASYMATFDEMMERLHLRKPKTMHEAAITYAHLLDNKDA